MNHLFFGDSIGSDPLLGRLELLQPRPKHRLQVPEGEEVLWDSTNAEREQNKAACTPAIPEHMEKRDESVTTHRKCQIVDEKEGTKQSSERKCVLIRGERGARVAEKS